MSTESLKDKLIAFEKWWDSWLEENHYYEAKEVDPNLIQKLKTEKKAAWLEST